MSFLQIWWTGCLWCVTLCVFKFTYTISSFTQKYSSWLWLLSLLKMYGGQRCHHCGEITPRGLKNRPWADYFQSKQTGLWGVCWSGAGRSEGGPEGSLRHSSASTKVFLRIKAMKLDSGKTVLTSFVWSSAAVIHGCFLAPRLELYRTSHGGEQVPRESVIQSSIKNFNVYCSLTIGHGQKKKNLGECEANFSPVSSFILWKIYGAGKCSWCSTSPGPFCERVFQP